jgi:hypothetical protein
MTPAINYFPPYRGVGQATKLEGLSDRVHAASDKHWRYNKYGVQPARKSTFPPVLSCSPRHVVVVSI